MNTTLSQADFNAELLRQHLAGSLTDDPVAGLLELAEEQRHKSENKGWQCSDMVDWVAEVYGDFAKLFVLLQNYSDEVCNGGHLQYYTNTFAGYGRNDSDCELHQEMARLFEEAKFHRDPLGRELLLILKKFHVSEEEEEEYDEEAGETVGTGTMEITNEPELEALDDLFDKINDAWAKRCAEIFKQWVAAGVNPMEALPDAAAPYVKPHLKLVGEDGNAFHLLGITVRALERAGAPDDVIARFKTEAKSGDYDHLLRTIMEYCEVD